MQACWLLQIIGTWHEIISVVTVFWLFRAVFRLCSRPINLTLAYVSGRAVVFIDLLDWYILSSPVTSSLYNHSFVSICSTLGWATSIGRTKQIETIVGTAQFPTQRWNRSRY